MKIFNLHWAAPDKLYRFLPFLTRVPNLYLGCLSVGIRPYQVRVPRVFALLVFRECKHSAKVRLMRTGSDGKTKLDGLGGQEQTLGVRELNADRSLPS